MWVLLTPREVELILRPAQGEGRNAVLLREVQTVVDRATGDLELTTDQVRRIRVLAHNWQGGHEKALKVLVEALDRHASDRPDGAA